MQFKCNKIKKLLSILISFFLDNTSEEAYPILEPETCSSEDDAEKPTVLDAASDNNFYNRMSPGENGNMDKNEGSDINFGTNYFLLPFVYLKKLILIIY